MPVFVILNIFFVVWTLIGFTPEAEPQGNPLNPPYQGEVIEPGLDWLHAERCYEIIQQNGMVEIGYDRDADDKADWITIHRVDRDQAPMQHALFYALDVDGNGQWEMVWIDLNEDGWNGNEELYQQSNLTTDVPIRGTKQKKGYHGHR